MSITTSVKNALVYIGTVAAVVLIIAAFVVAAVVGV